VGHVGSALCLSEILAVLFGEILDLAGGQDRDRLILSKGHAALVLYAALTETGHMSDQELDTFCGQGSRLGAHPEHVVDGIDFSTGSLGHGLSIAAGVALAARLDGSSRRVWVVLSDAELNEGSVWEAAMFAAHHRLGNLTAVLDMNGQQALGYTSDVLDLEPVAPRWRAFGWEVDEVDGHVVGQLSSAFSAPRSAAERPRLVVARTVFGRGVSFMDSRIEWHYLPLTDEQFAQADAELEHSHTGGAT
jgi:transketolase